ncbi:hypothetical protein BJV74DRAFT_978157 [Russula compacta]|nr:hypothetical protein BJV74DRAFT_978157 [Russula compacta]
MASMSTATLASSSSTTLTQESRPQAGPLPPKRGEIGFIQGVHEQSQAQPQVVPDPLPPRHPADHRPPSPLQGPNNGTPSHSESSPTPSDAASTSTAGKRYFFRRKRLPKFMGIHFTTLALLCFQIVLFAGTIAGWVFAALAIAASRANVPSPVSVSGQNVPPPNPGSGSSSIFIHVAFAVIALAQIVLIERRIFRVRAERYVFKHPGEVLPTSLRRGNSAGDATMAIAPWSRPSLPTYAAALAASGVGTGDVEDADIAQPPPPAYGKTRGSTLLLAGYLRHSLRVQAREHEQERRASSISMRSDRPISFISRDEEWETRQDADRARRIEEALAVLEDGRPVLSD